MNNKSNRLWKKGIAAALAFTIIYGAAPISELSSSTFFNSITAEAADTSEAKKSYIEPVFSLKQNRYDFWVDAFIPVSDTTDIKVTMEGKEVPIYRTDAGINAIIKKEPKKMGEEFTLTVKKNNKVISEKKTTIKDIAMNLINADENSDEAKALKCLLRYGAAAQKYFDYETDELVDAEITNSPIKGMQSLSSYKFDNKGFNDYLKSIDAPVVYDGMSLTFDDALGLKIIFSPAENTDLKTAEEYFRKNIKLSSLDSIKEVNGNKLCIVQKNILFFNINRNYSLQVGKNSRFINPMMFIANAYTEKNDTEEHKKLKELCRALLILKDFACEASSIEENTLIEYPKENEIPAESTSSVSSSTTTTTTATSTSGNNSVISTTASDNKITESTTTTAAAKTQEIINFEPTEEKGLYISDYSFDKSAYQERYDFSDPDIKLFTEYDFGHYILRLINVRTLSVIDEKEFSHSCTVFVRNDIIAVADPDKKIISFYNTSFENLLNMPLVRGYEISYFDRDLNYIAMSNYSTGSNIVYDIKNNVQIELPEELKYCYFYKFVDDHFILTTQDGMYVFYLDGSYEQTEYENEYYYRPSNDYECYCSQLNKDKMTITNYMTNENVCVLHGAGKSESVVAYFGNRFITSQGNYYTFYDRINSKKSQNYLLKNLYIYSVTDDNVLFGMAVYGKSSHYVKINLDEVTYDIDCTITEPAETKYGFESYFKKPETSDPELKTLVDELDEKYNIEVSFELADDREHSIDCYDMIDFNGDKIAALNDVKDYLSLWPEDICREITGDPDVKVWIYICDDITPNVNNPEIITPAGYVTEYDGHPTMCIITYNNNTEAFLNTFSHEFIHLLDYQLKPEQLQEWAAISPSDAYTNSYASYSGQNKYVDYSTGDTEIYFARDYGRTNCEEDRATIGEALYDSYVMEARKKCLDFEGTKAKCEALCRFMRECYPCLASVPEGELYLEKAMNMQAEYFKPRSNEENYQPDPGYGQG